MDRTDRRGSDGTYGRDASRNTTGPDSAEGEGKPMQNAQPIVSGGGQRSVSVLGWGLALAGGVTLWALILYAVSGQ